ncbi:MAG: NAD-dependent epimerase/dehydratase family protein [Alphaproteobacteria bacterium]|nr:NAD-dependent epimerase/dehydratase family protein [Alphaproteobacteria bacterium]
MQLVTGGAGFLGSHLVDALVRMGKRVRVLDSLAARRGDDGARLRERIAKFGRAVEFVQGDVRDPDIVRRAVDGARRVFHLAHVTGSRLSIAEAGPCLETNVLGTQNLLDAMDRAHVEAFVLCSHGLVYGEAGTRASRETDAPAPTSPFAASMVAAEALTSAWAARTRGRVAIVRPFTTYGPRMRPDSAVRIFLEHADERREIGLFGQDTSRDLVYAGDVVRALVESRRAPAGEKPSVFNVAWGKPVGILELVREIEVVTGARVRTTCLPHQPGEPKHTWGSPDHTEELLDLRPKTPLSEGLSTTLRWLRRSGAARTTTP